MAELVETPRVRLVVAGASGVGGAQAVGDAAFDPCACALAAPLSAALTCS